jgi:hypothetical protein
VPTPLKSANYDFRDMCRDCPRIIEAMGSTAIQTIICRQCGNRLHRDDHGIWFVAERAQASPAGSNGAAGAP